MDNIEVFCQSAIAIIIQDIMEIDMIIPRLVYDYSKNPNIKNGYYMAKNIAGDIITLNMNSIKELKYKDDIKTVIVYGFIHEILHMFQYINSNYFKYQEYNNTVEDITDFDTINFIRNNLSLIESRLKFTFNTVFLKGIERQLETYRIENRDNVFFNTNDNQITYINNVISGVLCNKLNLNYDYIRNLLSLNENLQVIFPDKREYNISLNYGTIEELNLLINLIYLTNFKFIYIKKSDKTDYPFLIKLELYE